VATVTALSTGTTTAGIYLTEDCALSVDTVTVSVPEFSSTASHLDGVLVVSHQEKDLVTFHAAVTGLNIGTDFFKRRAYVWPTVGIIDCCR
jgi:hypothetical protein